MPPQHDWQKHLELASEPGDRPDPADPVTSAGEPDQPGQPGAPEGAEQSGEPEQPEGAEQSGEPEQPEGAEQQTDTSAQDPGRSGWSGRAIGPLSRLLPGGAAELDPAELPVGPSASEIAAGEESPAMPSAGDHESSTALPDQASPGAQPDEAAEVAEVAEEPEPDLTSTDDRWHAALVGFVDDPRGSVEAARSLIDEDIAAHVALLARRREAMHAAWQAPEDPDTEALRVALVKYRDLRKRLADVLSALTV
jgi:hypothetical protein